MQTYTIQWGHSGDYGHEWMTAQEASQYASEEWGTISAEDEWAAMKIYRAEAGPYLDWHESEERIIHVITAPDDGCSRCGTRHDEVKS